MTSSAVRTAARVASETPGLPFSTRLTVASLTRAWRAISKSLPGMLQAYGKFAQFLAATLSESAQLADEIRDRVDDARGPEREPLCCLARRRAGEHEHRVHSGLEAAQDVRVHAVSDHRRRLRVSLDRVQRRSHHQRVRLAD